MRRLWIEIVADDGTTTRYENVSSITPKVVYDYYYDVQTMDGKRHRKVKGKRTNYDVVFFNKGHEEYIQLKKYLRSKEVVKLNLPYGEYSYIQGDFLCTVSGDIISGKTVDGKMYSTGLSVSFERIDYDAH